MKEKTGIIYRFYHKASMKSYIGKTIYPKRRIHKHLNGDETSPALYNAIKKYGKDAFVVEILESDVPESQLAKLEILYIRFFNSKRTHGYNLTDGGDGTIGHTKVPWNKGKTGIYSEESIQRMSEARKDMAPWNKGKRDIYSEETLQKMSEARKGKPNPLIRHPDYESADALYLSLPANMPIEENFTMYAVHSLTYTILPWANGIDDGTTAIHSLLYNLLRCAGGFVKTKLCLNTRSRNSADLNTTLPMRFTFLCLPICH